jgi:hypothetical protein
MAPVTKEGHLTTWLFRDGKWTQLHDAPVGLAADTSGWNPAFGPRLDANATALDDVTVLTR